MSPVERDDVQFASTPHDNELPNAKLTKEHYMSRRLLTAIASATLLACAGGSHAATQLGEYFTFSGFGTLGYVRADTSEGEYVREQQGKGADKSGSLLVDSNLGLQLTAKANDWLSGTVQTLTEMRYNHDEMTTRAEWAFVKVTPVEGLSLRAGKFGLPNFLISDSRKVGYANNWLRPANEVYGLDLLNGGLKGIDVSYRLPVAGQSLTISALGGKSAFTDPIPNPGTAAGQRDVDDVRGVNLLLEGDWYTLRVGHLTARPTFSDFLLSVSPQLADETYKFTGIGGSLDYNDIVLQAEFVKRRSSTSNVQIAADAWYLLGGYRMGKVLAYGQIAERKRAAGSGIGLQKSTALGVRWDAFSSAAVKFQAERVDTKDTVGASFYTPAADPGPFAPHLPVTKPVNTFSVAIDFVF
jgi:Gram-negative porin